MQKSRETKALKYIKWARDLKDGRISTNEQLGAMNEKKVVY